MHQSMSPQNMESLTKQRHPSVKQGNWRYVPKANININNLLLVKESMSRNEEQEVARKKGFVGFEKQNSFFAMNSPKEEDHVTKLLEMK